jgi:DNA-binding transcriptional ArsR family regulator
MERSASALLPILRSRVQGDLLALLFLHPDTEYSLSEAAQTIGASVKAVHHEASRLVTAGLIHDRRRGNQRLIKAATHNLLARPLTDLLAVTHGPLPVLTDLLAELPGIEQALIYGSWAARYHGQAGPIPADVDVLIIGSADPDDLDEAATDAQRRLGRPVNIRRIRPATWNDPTPADPFLRSVRSRPLVPLRLRRDPTAGQPEPVEEPPR